MGIETAILGSAVIGAGASMSASNKAAKAQGDAANQANATQLQMYNQSREDQMPAMQRGNAAGDKLAMLLGLDTTPAGPLMDGGYAETRDNFDTEAYLAANPDVANNKWASSDPFHHYMVAGKAEGRAFTPKVTAQQAVAQNQINKADPLYGSLLKNFSEQDFWNDPVTKLGFQFGLDEGTKGLNRQAAANGGLDSGATLKALTRYATDYTGTKGNEAFNRFNTNRDSTFNKLATLAGVGQQATQQVGSQAIATGQGIAQNQIGVGNARAASAISGANALTNGLSQGMNWYQGNQLMNKLNYQPNAMGTSVNPYSGWNASANGGWGIE